MAIATDASEVAVLYTCSSLSGGAVSYAYYESYTEPMNFEYARTGDQTAVLASSSFTAYFPAVCLSSSHYYILLLLLFLFIVYSLSELFYFDLK